MSRTKVLSLCTLVASLVLLAGSAFAAAGQSAPDTLKVDYYANAGGSADATIRIVNPGTAYAWLCADFYVFDNQEELTECCSCPLSPNDLRTLSLNTDLNSNPLTGTSPKTGSIAVISAASQAGHTCALPDGHPSTGGTAVSPTAALRQWVTHIQNNGTLTETVSPDATLSVGELNALQTQCYGIAIVGSGKGICSCGTGS
jgi:hypothetical protein